jgi:hypothetical protein
VGSSHWCHLCLCLSFVADLLLYSQRHFVHWREGGRASLRESEREWGKEASAVPLRQSERESKREEERGFDSSNKSINIALLAYEAV